MERHDSLAPIKEIKKEEPQIVEVQEIEEKIDDNKKSIDEIAHEVMDGKWGYGRARINKIKAAGYDIAEIQDKIKEILNEREENQE